MNIVRVAAVAYSLCVANIAQSVSLTDVYALAIENDQQLQTAKRTSLADKTLANTRRADLLPQINGQATWRRSDIDTDNSGQTLIGNTVVDNDNANNSDITTREYRVSLEQSLVNMGAWYRYQQGRTLASVADLEYSQAQQNLILRVAQAYFNVLSSVDQLKATTAEKNALKLQLKQTKQRYDVGLISINDVHDAQAAYDGALANSLAAQGAVGISFDALSVLTGEIHQSVAPLNQAFPVTQPTPLDKSAWVEFAKANNFELAISQQQVTAANLNTKASNSGHLPTLTGSLNYVDSDSDTDTNQLSSNANTETHTIALNLNIPIYSGGRTSSIKREAYQRALAIRDAARLTERNVIQSVRSLHLSVVTDVAQVNARKQAIVSNSSALDATKAGYDAGTRDIVDVVNAQRNLYQAQRNFADALYQYIINTLELKAVAGTLSIDDLKALEQWLDKTSRVDRANPIALTNESLNSASN